MKTDDWVTGQITLSVRGAPLEMQMTVPAKPVKPQRMLPIFRQIANSFTELGVKAIEEVDKQISCKKVVERVVGNRFRWRKSRRIKLPNLSKICPNRAEVK